MKISKDNAWCLYDWANSAFVTTVVAAVLPVYFHNIICSEASEITLNILGIQVHSTPTSLWGYAMALAALLVAVFSPIFGAAADIGGRRKQFLGILTTVGVCASALLWFTGPGNIQLVLGLLILGQIGFAGANVFYNSLLLLVAKPGERDTISARGFAFGYLGGGILLAVNLLMIRQPGLFGIPDSTTATRFAFLSVALWWALFSIPLFVVVPGRGKGDNIRSHSFTESLIAGLRTLRKTLGEIRKYSNLFRFLISFLIYNDGIQTVIMMAAIFAVSSLNLGTSSLIGALLLTQAVGVPASIIYGRIAKKIGAKKAITAGIIGYLLIIVYAFRMQTAAEFWGLAAAVGLLQGGIQAVSRSFYSRLIPPDKSSEFFGFFAISTRFASIFGPLLFALIADITGNIRLSILVLSVFFLTGGIILAGVKSPSEIMENV